MSVSDQISKSENDMKLLGAFLFGIYMYILHHRYTSVYHTCRYKNILIFLRFCIVLTIDSHFVMFTVLLMSLGESCHCGRS